MTRLDGWSMGETQHKVSTSMKHMSHHGGYFVTNINRTNFA